MHAALVVFVTKDEEQTRQAYAATKAMLEPAARLGYGEYRSHLDFMNEVAALYDFNNIAQRRFAERIKVPRSERDLVTGQAGDMASGLPISG